MAREIEGRKELVMLPQIPIERIPRNVFVDLGHTWVEIEPAGLVKVGADWMPATLLGKPEKVDFAMAGTEVKRGDVIMRLRRHGRTLALRAPVDGVVEEVNGALVDNPDPITSDPFGAGWLYRIAPANLGSALRAMLIDDEAANWMHREVRRLRDALSTLSRRMALGGQSGLAAQLALATAGPTLQDGGLPVQGLADELDPESWNELANTFFEA
jgi:glycine cleavage system H protein